MKRIAALVVVILVLAGLFAAFRLCVTKVPIGYVGVRSNLMGGGIDQEDLAPGYHMAVPGLHRIQLVDARQKVMEWSGAQQGGGGFQLTATDQVTLWLDVTLIYSLEPGTGHLAIRKYGEGSGFERQMRVLATKVIAEVLAQMQSKDFYDAPKRMNQAQLALDELNRMMQAGDSREYMVADDLLIRNIIFPEAFENRLLEKQLLDQKQLLHEAETKMEAALEVTQTIEKQTLAKVLAIQEDMAQALALLQAQTDAQIAEIDAGALYYTETKIAEAEQFKRERLAQGELAKTQAQAMGERATGAAYAGAGGALLLLRKMVENVQLGDITINTNRTNPFDVMEMLRMLGGADSGLSQNAASPESLERARQIIRDIPEVTFDPATRPVGAGDLFREPDDAVAGS